MSRPARPGHRILLADRVVTARAEHSPGFVELAGDRVVDVGAGVGSGRARRIEGTIMPAFVDPHVHGALGSDFGTAEPPEVEAIADFHAARGSTRLLASIATAPLAPLEAAVSRLAPLVANGVVAGIHLEGPYLSPVRRGAHDAALLRLPTIDEVARLVELGGGAIRMVTIAPELPGALEVISWLVQNGVTVALGHSDCTASEAAEAFDRGATVATHLFNGMRPLHHREPGLVGAALTDERVLLELIMDGHHIASSVSSLVRRVAPGRLALVSDAMSATGLGDGEYSIAGSSVVVEEGVAMLRDGSSLAGSTATVGDALVRLAAEAPGFSNLEAVAVSSASASAALGLEGTGLAPASRADLVVVDAAFRVTHVMRAGEWLATP